MILFQVVNVVDGMYRHQSSEDVYEEWDQAILQTLKNCPLKVNFLFYLFLFGSKYFIIVIHKII